MRTALDEACTLSPEDRKSEIAKSAMAQRILKQAAEGVRDPVTLRTSALVDGSLFLGDGVEAEGAGSRTQIADPITRP